MENILKWTGIAGLALFILFIVFKSIIKKNIFPSLNQRQGYNILRLIIFSIFIIAVISLAIYYNQSKMKKQENSEVNETDSSIKINGSNNNIIQGNNNTVTDHDPDSLTKTQRQFLDSTN